MAISTVKLNGTTMMTVNDTTAVAANVETGKYFYGADGVKTEGTGGGAKIIASGTYTGSNTYYIYVPVGTNAPSKNFAFYMWTTAEMPYSNAKYKIIMLSYFLTPDLGYIGSDGKVVSAISTDINNDGTITTKSVPPQLGYVTVYNDSVSSQGYSILQDRPSWAKSNDVLNFYWNRNNSQYTFPTVSYNWKLIYFGPNYENEHIVVW